MPSRCTASYATGQNIELYDTFVVAVISSWRNCLWLVLCHINDERLLLVLTEKLERITVG